MTSHSRGTLEQLLRQGDYQAAVAVAVGLRRQAPGDAHYAALHGHALVRLGQHDAARAVLEQAIGLGSPLPSVWIDLAQACVGLADWARAGSAARHFVAIAPGSGTGWFALGQVALATADHDLAEQCFARAGAVHAGFVDQRLGLGHQAFDLSDFATAIRHYLACVRQRPQWREAWLSLSASLVRAGDREAARACLQEALAHLPGEPRLLQRQAQLLAQLPWREAERIACCRDWLRADPGSAEAAGELGLALLADGQGSAALSAFAQAGSRAPQSLLWQWAALHTATAPYFEDQTALTAYLARWRAGLAACARLDFSDPINREQCERAATLVSNHRLAYLGDALRDDLRRYAAVLSAMVDQVVPQPQLAPARPRTRRRVGVVSASLRQHSAARVWSELLIGLDRRKIELFGFHLATVSDDQTERWRERCEHFDAGPHRLAEWVRVLVEADLDVLILLGINDDPLSPALATRRMAPVQCSTWAFPMSSGQATIDYFLSSDLAEPEDGAEHYCESLVRLPGLAAAYTPVAALADVPPPGPWSEHGHTRIACLQSGSKLLPVHDALFVRVLAASTPSRLALLPSLSPVLCAGLAARMDLSLRAADVASDRVQWFPRLGFDAYLGVLARADFLLDSLHWSGGLTSLDALSLDVPIVTLPGKLMRGRQTAAMLRLLELPELIASDFDEYLRIAARLAHSPDFRIGLRARIRERKHRLSDYRDSQAALLQFLCEAGPATLPAQVFRWTCPGPAATMAG